MTDKNRVIKIYCDNADKTISDGYICDTAGITAEKLSEIIEMLTNNGLKIEKSAGGSRMASSEIAKIGPEICRETDGGTIMFDETDSTNLQAKKLFADGICGHGSLIAARSQTGGRGRLGRSFYSPSNSGIYMSVILCKNEIGSPITEITSKAAVAVCRAIEELFPAISPQIKWVNDIYVGGKKVCGILAEAVNDADSGKIAAVIVGIGVNMSTEFFPDGISQTAGSLGVDSRYNGLFTAMICDNLIKAASSADIHGVMDEYRAHSLVIGKKICYFGADSVKNYGVAVGIDDGGGLIVDDEKRGRIILSTGEISLRLADR